jgi:hypothetical protein
MGQPKWARCRGGETRCCDLQRKYSGDRFLHGALASDSQRTLSYCDYDSHNLLNPCTVCKKHGHDAKHLGCWFNAENKLREAAKMKSDAEAILKSGWFCRNRLVLQLRFSEMLSCLRRLVCHAAFTISCSLCRP